MNTVSALLLAVSTAWTVAGFIALVQATRRRQTNFVSSMGQAPNVSVLKPLCGADAQLTENLETFFTQDYSNYELIFGTENADDPALDIVRELQERYPNVRCKIVVHAQTRGANPKVRNLRGMIPEASSDLLLISDSNVRAPNWYLDEMIATYFGSGSLTQRKSSRDIGLVTNIFVGTGEQTFGAALENVQLNGFCAAGAALPTLLGDALVVGKSMLFSRATFDSCGGIEHVADVLAEDFVIGKMFQHAGYDIKIAPTVLSNVTAGSTLSSFVMRHLRWAMLRWRLRPLAYLLEPLINPLLVCCVVAPRLGIGAWCWMFAIVMLRDVGQWILLRGPRRAWIPLVLGPVRDVFALGIWLWAPLKRHVSWRGNRARLGAGTMLYLK